MKYNLCSACVNFQPRLLTEEKSIPKSCLCDVLHDVFGADAGGFPSGCDIIHCDFFIQHAPFDGDVALRDSSGHYVSYVLTSARNFKLVRCPKLYDNSKNIKIYEIDRKSKTGIESCPF